MEEVKEVLRDQIAATRWFIEKSQLARDHPEQYHDYYQRFREAARQSRLTIPLQSNTFTEEHIQVAHRNVARLEAALQLLEHME